jgi:general secretion pathway protein A
MEDAVPEPAASLAARLGSLDSSADAESGVPALLALWGVAYDSAAGSACSQVEARGLSCYFQRGSWNGIRQLDRPAVLTLVDDAGRTHQVVLASLTDERAELAFADERVSVSLDELDQYWFGQYMLIWDPPGDTPVVIGPGLQNDNVRWLRQSLAALDADYNPEPPDSDVFDAELESRLTAFQRRHRLEADGLACQKTQIIINTLLAPEGTPRLTSTP